MQEDQEGTEKVIAYGSRGTRGAEKKYGATQLECLVVVWAMELYRHYLLGRPFTLITDNSALKWLIYQSEPKAIYA